MHGTPRLLAWPLAAALFLSAAPSPAQSDPQHPPAGGEPSRLSKPAADARLHELERRLREAFAARDYVEAEAVSRDAIRHVPWLPENHYNLACALAMQGRTNRAVSALQQAVALGFNRADVMERDADLASIRETTGFRNALVRARSLPDVARRTLTVTVSPVDIRDGQALVTSTNTAWDPSIGLFRTFFQTPPDAEVPPRVTTDGAAIDDRLNQWYADGTAAGLAGDLYDNRDGEHSLLEMERFPQLARIVYGREAREKNLHHGLQLYFQFNRAVFGNSSTAMVNGPFWGSLPRRALTSPGGARKLFAQYLGNQLYVYPEHKDHDPGRNGKGGYGDLLPANTPYLVVTQGSSWSDKPFLEALAKTLAAFQPEVKAALTRSGLLAPTLQVALRRTARHVASDADYLDGRAHPSVFDAEALDGAAMVEWAHRLALKDVPPLVLLRVVEEREPEPGIDVFAPNPSERLFDTPCAIARVARSSARERRMVVSATDSKDPNGHPLTFRWVLLRGDPERIELHPRDPRGEEAELVLRHHERRPVQPGSELESNRVDIGVFAHNGVHWSAPSFVSVLYLDHEQRTYDAEGRIAEVDYMSPEVHDRYVDPAVDLKRDWRDVYRYHEAGRLLGWYRYRADGRQSFTPDGALVLEADERRRPLRARVVRYEAKIPDEKKAPVVAQVPTDRVRVYTYASDDDRFGRFEERTEP